MKRLWFPILMGVVGVAVLLALGIWQVQRMTWKGGVLADIEARIGAAPVALPQAPDPEADRYLPVDIEGAFTGDRLRVLTSLGDLGPGYRIVEGFDTARGARIMVDRGFVRQGDEDRLDSGAPEGGRVIGNLHWPQEVDGWTPEPEGNLWFARDVDAMAAALGTEPVLVVAAEVTADAQGVLTAVPIATGDIANNHLEYAITWFSLAVVWAGMSIYLVARARRMPKEDT